MQVLIYSDVHGNLPAFEQLLKKEKYVDAYINLGDLVNYGPWSNECVELALSMDNSVHIMGNHEESFLEGTYPGTNAMVQKAFHHTLKEFTRFDEIKDFQEQYQLDDFVCRHTILDQYIYPDTEVMLDNNYVVGHSHHQFEYAYEKFVLYNAGSIGQNRKFINKADYLIYDSESKKIEMRSLIFDIDIVINKMISRKYPEEVIQYYQSKSRV